MKGDHEMSKKKNEAFGTSEEILETTPEEEKIPQSSEEEKTGDAPEEADPVRKALDEANAKAAEYLALAQRVQADFENFRRRNESIIAAVSFLPSA